MKLNLTATPNSNGSVTVKWAATFENAPRYITISMYWARKVGTNFMLFSGVYGWDSANTSVPVELSGERTVFPPPGTKTAWATLIGNICQFKEGRTEIDQYDCAPTVYVKDIKL